MKRQGAYVYGSVREGACVEEVENYFSEAPPPEGLSAARARVDAFVRVHQAVGRPIVLVTAGGTTVPLEVNTVRFIDNFSAGTRGAVSTEYFVRNEYAVIYLHRLHCHQPFTNHFSHAVDHFMDFLSISADGRIEFNGDAAGIPDLKRMIEEHKAMCAKQLLISVPFVTVHDYMFLLRECCQALHTLGSDAVIYAAAAVSDFYVPWKDMAQHKMQSSDGPPEIKLTNSPKMLLPLRHKWCPDAFVVSFKLETDRAILMKKSHNSITAYGMDLVIANELKSRKDEVFFVTADSEERIVRAEADAIEAKMIPRLIELHASFKQTSKKPRLV